MKLSNSIKKSLLQQANIRFEKAGEIICEPINILM